MALAQLTAGAQADIARRRRRVRRLALVERFSPLVSLKKLSRAVKAARVHIGFKPTAGHPLGEEDERHYFAELFEDVYLVIWSFDPDSDGPARIEAICHTGVLGTSPSAVRTLADADALGILRGR